MLDGKRGTAASIVYGALSKSKKLLETMHLKYLETAMENIMPVLEVRARRVGGSNYQVPVEVRPERRTTLGLRWLVTIARLRGEHTMQDRLAKKSWMLLTTLVQLLRNVKTLTVWLKLTVHSHTSVGKIMILRTVRSKAENRKLTQNSTNTRKFIFPQHPVPSSNRLRTLAQVQLNLPSRKLEPTIA